MEFSDPIGKFYFIKQMYIFKLINIAAILWQMLLTLFLYKRNWGTNMFLKMFKATQALVEPGF